MTIQELIEIIRKEELKRDFRHEKTPAKSALLKGDSINYHRWMKLFLHDDVLLSFGLFSVQTKSSFSRYAQHNFFAHLHFDLENSLEI